MSAPTISLTLKENLVMRLIGLFVFVAPRRGSEFLASVVVGVQQRLEADEQWKEDELERFRATH